MFLDQSCVFMKQQHSPRHCFSPFCLSDKGNVFAVTHHYIFASSDEFVHSIHGYFIQLIILVEICVPTTTCTLL